MGSNMEFDALRHQFSGHWQAIEQADPALRRVLVAELGKILLEWEAAQGTPLEGAQSLRRIGYWSSLATLVAEQSGRIVEQIGQDKQALTIRLNETAQRIKTAKEHGAALETDIKLLADELALEQGELERIDARIAELERQRESLRVLSGLREELDQARSSLGRLAEQLEQGEDPVGVLEDISRLVALREALISHYRAYLDASGRIVECLRLPDPASVQGVSSPELEQVPRRLCALDQELKAIDDILARQLSTQDKHDRIVESRTLGTASPP
jgi:cell division protein FtsB